MLVLLLEGLQFSLVELGTRLSELALGLAADDSSKDQEIFPRESTVSIPAEVALGVASLTEGRGGISVLSGRVSCSLASP